MLNPIILHPREGRVVMTIPAPGYSVDDIIHSVVPSETPNVVLDFSTLHDMDFRDAWVFDPSDGYTVDIEIAREIHRNRIRAARASAFQKADRDFMLALETSDEVARAEVVARKVLLRDLPSSVEISSAVTLTDLRSFWSVELLGPSPYSR